MDYSQAYAPGISDGAAALIAVLVILFYLLILGIGLVSYILSSLAYYKIAKRRNIANPWLSWIPIGDCWIVGRIANDYDKRNGYNRKWHIALVTLSLIATVILTIFYIMYFISIITGMSYGADIDETTGLMLVSLAGIMFGAIAASAYSVLSGICVYKTFESTRPEKALLYTILHFMVPLAGPICLVICMDKGYEYTEEAPVSEHAYVPTEDVIAPEEGAKDEPTETTEE